MSLRILRPKAPTAGVVERKIEQLSTMDMGYLHDELFSPYAITHPDYREMIGKMIEDRYSPKGNQSYNDAPEGIGAS